MKKSRGNTIWYVTIGSRFADPYQYEIKAKLARVAMSRALGRFQRDSGTRLGFGWSVEIRATSSRPYDWKPPRGRR